MQFTRSPILLKFSQQRFYFDIPMGRTLIGRLPRCQLAIGSGGVGVSREHAEIIRMSGDLFIKDLDSHNGTFVNGQDIRGLGPVQLNIGDRIDICEFKGELTTERLPFDDSGLCHVASDIGNSIASNDLDGSSVQSKPPSHAIANISDTRILGLPL
jgi:predicted component of type VI protein secretion system